MQTSEILHSSLLSLAKNPDSAALTRAAQEFEALFLGELFKVMRESTDSEGLFGESSGHAVYTSMIDQEVARVLARSGGLGLAKMIEERLGEVVTSIKKEDSAIRQTTITDENISETETRLISALEEFTLSSATGWRKDPISGGWRYHRGVDLAASKGAEIPSLSSGSVVFAGTEGSYGKSVVIESSSGLTLRYAHLSEISVTEGAEVSEGETIGEVGSSGRTTGSHLHLEVEHNSRLVDPLSGQYLIKAGLKPLTIAADTGYEQKDSE